MNAEKALNLALNKIAGDWDWIKLKEAFAELPTEWWDCTGFDDFEIEELLKDFVEINQVMEYEDPQNNKDNVAYKVIVPVDEVHEFEELMQVHGWRFEKR